MIIGFIILIVTIFGIVTYIITRKSETSGKTFVMPEKEIWIALVNKAKELEERIVKLELNNKEVK